MEDLEELMPRVLRDPLPLDDLFDLEDDEPPERLLPPLRFDLDELDEELLFLAIASETCVVVLENESGK